MELEYAPRGAERYARALYEYADDEQEREVLQFELEKLKDIWESSPEGLIGHPALRGDGVERILDIFKKRFHHKLYLLIKLLVRKRRMILIPGIARYFRKLREENKEIARVEVVSARKLADEVIGELQSRLNGSISGSHKVVLDLKTDPELLGGIVIKYRGKVYDYSIAHRLERLRDDMKSRIK